MKLFLPLCLLALASGINYAECNDEEVVSYWKRPLGWAFEQLGKWLQQSSETGYYTVNDSEDRPEAFTIENLKELGVELQKMAAALEKGEKVDLLEDLQNLNGDDSEYRFKITGRRIAKWAKQVVAAVHG